MSKINDIQDEIIEEFEGLTDWMDRYAYIIEMGNAMPPLDERYKTPDNIIDG
ncbi:MAG: SufE family protein, partial [bacterium]|nr:SufE family protein [bacterium]